MEAVNQWQWTKFPKTFGFAELHKGYFPHHWENWHSKQNGIFNFNEELYKYCLSYVEILRNGCLSYRKINEISKKNNFGIDPFLNIVTLPSACHLIYRRNFMRSQSIALIPDYGFYPTQNFSH
jgi:hypothetical protein